MGRPHRRTESGHNLLFPVSEGVDKTRDFCYPIILIVY
nr:MAG TPA: hypothetical protein [Caudoviricetes sp.]